VVSAAAAGASKVSQEAEKQNLKRKAEKGKYEGEDGLGELVNDANKAQARVDSVEAAGDRAVNNTMTSNAKLYGKEYVILIQGRDPIFVTKRNHETVLKTLLYEITEFLQMSKNDREKLTGWDDIEAAIRFYNRYAKPTTSN
jgi:hypothetical protein